MFAGLSRRRELLLLVFAAAVHLSAVVSPPSLMDDVDGAYARIAQTMLDSGDWITARLNGVKYLDKPPGQVWAMAASFAVFGANDWAARLPMALAAIALCWATWRFGRWAFGEESGFWAGLAVSSCLGLWLFTRARMPDVYLALSVTVSIWSALRLLEEGPRRRDALLFGASMGVGTLFKGLPAAVFPVAAVALTVLFVRRWSLGEALRRLRPVTVAAAFLATAAPWHVAAILDNPPYFDFTLTSEPGVYRGFFWRYFINEHLLRYLGLRHPRDYSDVAWFIYWPMHLAWLFPWSGLLPAAARLPFRAADRAGRVRLAALGWLGFVLVFFAFSTAQEYYTMSAYPAFALLIGDAAARGGARVRDGARIVGAVWLLCGIAAAAALVATAGVSPTGDISEALTSNPAAYTLSLGHLQDLTLDAFAWLRGPLILATLAFAAGAAACLRLAPRRAWAAAALTTAVFFQAARWAMVQFDPYLSSRPLAEALQRLPPGTLVVDDQYYSFSSLMFYADRDALLLNGRVNNIEYGAHAPGAPDVFLDDARLVELWRSGESVRLATFEERLPRLWAIGLRPAVVAAEAGGKVLLTNETGPRDGSGTLR